MGYLTEEIKIGRSLSYPARVGREEQTGSGKSKK
jgi:hypothetical protein